MGAGYAQLRPSQNGVMPSNEPAVVYARINHGSNHTRLRPLANEVTTLSLLQCFYKPNLNFKLECCAMILIFFS